MSRMIKPLIFLCIICIALACFYMTRPVQISDVLDDRPIKEIHILTESSMERLPKEVRVSRDSDFDDFMNILNKYRYARVLNYLNTTSDNPSGDVMHLFIFYDADNKSSYGYVFIDEKSHVAIRDSNGVNLEYRVSGNEQKLFEDLSNWLKLKSNF